MRHSKSWQSLGKIVTMVMLSAIALTVVPTPQAQDGSGSGARPAPPMPCSQPPAAAAGSASGATTQAPRWQCGSAIRVPASGEMVRGNAKKPTLKPGAVQTAAPAPPSAVSR